MPKSITIIRDNIVTNVCGAHLLTEGEKYIKELFQEMKLEIKHCFLCLGL